MEKTIREWAEELPEEEKEQFLKNLQNHYKERSKGILNMIQPSLSDAIMSGFLWVKSPEGSNYWNVIHTRAEQKELDQLV